MSKKKRPSEIVAMDLELDSDPGESLEVTLSLDEKTIARVREMAQRDGRTFDEALSFIIGALAEYALVYDMVFTSEEGPGPDDLIH